jgi:hypothetical protein
MPSKSAADWQQGVFAVLLAVAVVAFNVWTVRSVTPSEVRLFGGEQGDYSNLVMRSLLEGHTYVDVKPSPGLVKADNPYDPAKRPPGVALADASYYKGRYYIYFGVAPVVTLFLPWRLLTGHDLPAPYAALILVNGAFVASAGLFWMVRRRYFPDSGVLALSIGILVIGLGSMTHSVLRRTSLWEPPVAAGYLFAMLTLVCLYSGLHRRHRNRWFACASALLGLAVGSRPTYLVAIVALAVPLVGEWRRARKAGRMDLMPGRSWWGHAAALALPLGVILTALLGYNYARFENPFEFGMHYQLTGAYEATVRHFSAAYAQFNAYVYYLAPAQWSRYFPFVEPIRVPPAPKGYQTCEYVYGILTNLPISWAALLAPLALMRRRPDESGPLGEFLGSLAALYLSVGFTLLFFVTSTARYMVDFVPALMLLACIGLLSAERLASAGWARSLVAAAAASAGLFSVFVCAMLSFQLQGLLRQLNPQLFRTLAHAFDQPAWQVEKRAGEQFGPLELTLRFPEGQTGRLEPLVTTGWEFLSDYLIVNYIDSRSLRIGFSHAGEPLFWSQPLALDYGAEHKLRVEMGSLSPPRGHPGFDGLDDLQFGSVSRWLHVELDGKVALDCPQDFYDSSPGALRIGLEPTLTYGGKFTGRIERVARGHFDVAASPSGPCGPVELTIAIPPNAVGRQVPLITTGFAGRGDALLMRTIRPGVVQFYYDHWGDNVLAGGEVAVTGRGAHELVVSMPSLWRARDKPGSPLAKLLYIALDGRLLAMQEVAAYPATRASVFLGRNRIGSSLCEAEYPWAIRNVLPNIPLDLSGLSGAAVTHWKPPADEASVQREGPAAGEEAGTAALLAHGPRAALQVMAAAWIALAIWIGGRLAGLRWGPFLGRLVLTATRPLAIPATWIWRHKVSSSLAVIAAASGLIGWRQRAAYLQSFGPLHLRLMLPIGYWTRQQPILSTGKTGAGTMVFVTYTDQGHVQVGADIWGALYLSDQIAVNYSEPQDIVISASGLYPLDHPGAKALDPELLKSLRDDFFVAVGERTVLSQSRLAYESRVSDLRIGENRIESSFSQPKFAGRILGVRRLPRVREMRMLAGDSVHLRFRMDPAGMTDQPLLSLGANGSLGLIFAHPEYGPFLRVCLRSADGTVSRSALIPDPPNATHDVDVEPGYVDAAMPRAGARVTLDGIRVWSPDNLAAYSSCTGVLGLDAEAKQGVGQFFSGPEIGGELVSSRTQPRAASPTSGLTLVVMFQTGLAGSDPIVVSGATGAGDFVYVKYLAGNRLQFGCDHWGTGGVVGVPVAIDPQRLHRLEIETGSLRPSADNHEAAGPVRIKLDGDVVLDGSSPIHPHSRAQIFIGANPIGGSTSGPLFRGQILYSESAR